MLKIVLVRENYLKVKEGESGIEEEGDQRNRKGKEEERKIFLGNFKEWRDLNKKK